MGRRGINNTYSYRKHNNSCATHTTFPPLLRRCRHSSSPRTPAAVLARSPAPPDRRLPPPSATPARVSPRSYPPRVRSLPDHTRGPTVSLAAEDPAGGCPWPFRAALLLALALSPLRLFLVLPVPCPLPGQAKPKPPEEARALLHLPCPCATATTTRAATPAGFAGRNWERTEMMHAKSESDVTSLAASSPPRSPKRAGGGGGGGSGGGAGNGGYYVQSPSRESHDGGYKSSSMQATPVYNSPNESPSHPSYGRHSRSSSVSRFSGSLRKGGGDRKVLNDKGWPECNVIEEEGPYEDLAGDSGLSRRCQIILGFLTFVLLFTVFCLIIWGAARPYEPEVIVKSLVMDDFYAGEGTDHSGVPTKLVTTNCSLHIAVYNPATMFGIHVTSGPIHLIYSEISIAVGQVRRYYQPRKSHRMVTVLIHGEKVPLYGAGGNLRLSTSTGGSVPLTLDFDLTSRGYVIGKLVRVTHKVHVTCPVVLDAKNIKPVRFTKKACSVYKA